MRRRRLAATALVAALVLTAATATAAAGPKRGSYIDAKLQTYITTTKDVSAVKSFQTACIRNGSQIGSIMVNRKLKLGRSGGFSFTGKAKIYAATSTPYVDTVEIAARFTKGRFKGTVTAPEKYGCSKVSFSARYYGVNPKG